MSTLSLTHVSREEKTFAVAMALLGAVAAAQLLSALYFFTRRPPQAPAAIEHKTAATHFFPRPKKTTAISGATAKVPALEQASRTAVAPARPSPESVPETLLRVAKGFRERGDTTNAIAKLQQAAALDPGNADILAELALTYESMQLFDRSNEVWRRLHSLGTQAGPLFELAELKLRVGVPPPPAVTANGSPVPASGASAGDAAGVPDGSTFGISEVTLRHENDPDAETRMLLRVGVKARPDTPIDHTKVKIQVFFYDMVNNDQVVLTNADVSYEWVTPGHDWGDTGTEVLDVTYLRPKHTEPAPGTPLAEQNLEVPDSVEKAMRAARKPSTGADLLPANETGPRQYLGYIVQVYYKDQLQAVRADPTRLLNLFPPPFTAPPQ